MSGSSPEHAKIRHRRTFTMKWITALIAALMILFSAHADAAKRLGGGKSVGQQSSNVSKREAAKPATPAQQQAGAPQQTAAPAAATPQKRPWGAMLGGLAAGLGLAWLASSLGLGAEFGQFLMFALLALVIMMAVGWFMRSRKAAATQTVQSPFALQGAGTASPPAHAKEYNPANVGNDASARPWERQSMAFDASKTAPQSGSMIGSAIRGNALDGNQAWGIPENFDLQGFIASAKQNFVTLQSAWDKSDISTLRSMMTDEMLAEIRTQLDDREQIRPNASSQTDVVMLEAQLLGIEDLNSHYLASVEFSGMIREDAATGPAPFREVWNMTKPKDGSSGWLVAGLQALQ
jgi:predicted lipid-binding transport protein (Tim44 family)